MTVITTVISTANVIGRRNMSGTIGTPIRTRAKDANAGQCALYRPAQSSTATRTSSRQAGS
jgi:hypothetical protein